MHHVVTDGCTAMGRRDAISAQLLACRVIHPVGGPGGRESRGHTDRHAKQDVDNLAKSILDGMQKAGAFAEGDQQVYTLGITKYPAEKENMAIG